VSHVEDIETLREEIDRLDREIVEKIAEWVKASKEVGRTNSEAFTAQIQRLASKHGIDVKGVKRVFKAMVDLVEEERAG
jgi:chorismate mutase